MASRTLILFSFHGAAAGIIALLLFSVVLTGGCLRTEPEELPPQASSPLPAVSVSVTVPINTTENESSPPPAVAITSPRLVRIFTEQAFPPEVNAAVSDFADGKTTDTINGFLRWESVRARTNVSEAARIREQIRRIDYALFNTTAKENISVYIGISGEQARRIRNESVYTESGYIIASYDPSVVYHRLANAGRDSEGYLTMCVVDLKRGNRILFVNATDREFILPRDGIWDVAREDRYEKLEFTADSIPRYMDIIPTKVRLIHTKEHP
jgi:hypothetical protein